MLGKKGKDFGDRGTGTHRGSEPEKLKGGPVFLIQGFPSEQQRIQALVSQQELLDLKPSPPPYTFRPRDSSKDINPRMYFQHRTSLERVKQAASYTNFIECPLTLASKATIRPQSTEPRYSLPSEIHTTSTSDYRSKSPPTHPKSILPSLHHKTHFQALSAIMTRAPQRSLVSLAVSSRNTQGESLGVSLDEVVKLGVVRDDQAAYVAKTVLETCGVVGRAKSVNRGGHTERHRKAKSGENGSSSQRGVYGL